MESKCTRRGDWHINLYDAIEVGVKSSSMSAAKHWTSDCVIYALVLCVCVSLKFVSWSWNVDPEAPFTTY